MYSVTLIKMFVYVSKKCPCSNKLWFALCVSIYFYKVEISICMEILWLFMLLSCIKMMMLEISSIYNLYQTSEYSAYEMYFFSFHTKYNFFFIFYWLFPRINGSMVISEEIYENVLGELYIATTFHYICFEYVFSFW